jgi:hypothetical protein
VCASAALWRAFDKAVRRKPPVVAADAGGFLQVVESKARKHATPCARLASSRFRFNTKTYRDLFPNIASTAGPEVGSSLFMRE